MKWEQTQCQPQTICKMCCSLSLSWQVYRRYQVICAFYDLLVIFISLISKCFRSPTNRLQLLHHSFSPFKKESSEKHLNYKLTDVKSMPRLPCGKGCDESNDYSAFSWHDFLELIFDALKMPNTTNNIDSDEPIMLFDSSYIENLEGVLNSTSPR